MWTEKAACIDWDVNLFFSNELPDQLFAQSICHSCPVRQECEDSGDAEDFKWAVRAGYLPGTFKGAPKRAPLIPKILKSTEPSVNPLRSRARDDWSHKYGKLCPHGHEHSATNTDKFGDCIACRKIKNARRAMMSK